MEGRVEVGKKRRVSEVRREMLPYVQNRLEDIEINTTAAIMSENCSSFVQKGSQLRPCCEKSI